MHKVNQENAAFAKPDSSQPQQADYLNYLQSQKPKANTPTEFIFADEKMLRIREIIHQIANANVPVLISGESGTGKELIAKMIHASSDRRNETFITANCNNTNSNLLETELFGIEAQAFPGAGNGLIGKFEQASGGTLLLDEVADIDQNLQAKILRTLQENTLERTGSNQTRKIDTRVIATTHKDLSKSVTEGSFRQDLFYRLYVIHLEIPALRDRKKDIEVLSRHFLRSFSQQYRDQPLTMTADAMQKLVNYPWPGNVRELQNTIQRAVIMSHGSTLTADLFNLEGKKVTQDQDWVKHLPIGRKMREVETQFIIETLKSHQGNRTHSAKTLGISLRTLRNKINEFTIEGHEVPQPTTGKPL